MDQSLRDAAQEGSIDALHSLVRGDPYILDTIDKIPFVETPLHIAASAGHTQFAMEIVRLKPSLAWKLNQYSFSPMHLALQNNQTHVVCRLLDADKDLVRVQGKEGATPLHHVAQAGNLYLLSEFRKVCPMSIKDVTIRGETALHFALSNNKLDAFEFLIRWLQQTTLEDASSLWENKLLNWKNEEGNTLLHIAVSNNQPQVVRWLLNARVDTNATNLAGFTALDILEGQTQINNNEIRDMLASSLPRNMENAADLRDAAKQGSIDALYELIQMDAKVLDRMDNIPFVETPLHIAASAGHTWFAMEIMRLKPSFARKLNQDGFSPMHLALQNNKTQLVERLLDVDSEIVRVPGKEGVTPFHYVAQMGNIELLTKFSEGCPESYEDVTIRRENVLHVALKYGKVEAFRHMLGWIRQAWFKDASLWESKLLHWKDEKHNTLLHVAVSRNQHEVVSLLLDTGFVDLDAKNLEGDTVFDILAKLANQRISDMLMRRKRPARCLNRLAYCLLSPLIVLLRQHRVNLIQTLEKCSVKIRRQQTVITGEQRNALLVVAALLITVTYPTALSPDEQPNEFNCTAPINATGANQNFNFTALNPINATGANHYFSCTARFNDSVVEVQPNRNQDGEVFLWCNTLTFYLANFTLFFLLPTDFLGIVLFFLLIILACGFSNSSPLVSAYLIIGLVSLLPVYLLPWLSTFRLKHFSSDIK